MPADTRPQEARGLAVVQDIVQAGMQCGWQEFDHINDNGIDGLIIDRSNGVDTGTAYHVQVKCGEGYLQQTKKRPDQIEVKLGANHIETHLPRWRRLQGPVILVYVDFHSRKAWWTSLKDEASYCPEENRGIVLIDKQNRFGDHSIGHLRKLRGFYDLDRRLDVITLTKQDLVLGPFSKNVKSLARARYRQWASMSAEHRTNSRLGEILVSRVGWRHITRRGRGAENILQSWSLLGAAQRIILENEKPYQLRMPDLVQFQGVQRKHDYVSLRSRCIFPNRQETVVQVVVKRLETLNLESGAAETRSWFYSVHEPRKGKRGH
jgi:hypothetical protein